MMIAEEEYANDYALKEYDFWYSAHNNISFKKSNRLSNSQEVKAKKIIDIMQKFDSEVGKLCDKANKLVGFPNEFVHVDPGKYAIAINEKGTYIWKYFAGVEYFNMRKEYNECKDEKNKKDKWNTYDEVCSDFKKSIEKLGETYSKKYPDVSIKVSEGSTVAETPPCVDYCGLYWMIEIKYPGLTEKDII
jgi:hypothetical protein